MSAQREEQDETPLTIGITDLDVFMKLHTFYQAVCRVHGDDQLEWIKAMPEPVMRAYCDVGQSLRALAPDIRLLAREVANEMKRQERLR